MLFKTSKILSLCGICLAGSLLSINAQSSGATFSGSMPGLQLDVLGNRALFKNDGVFPNVSPLSIIRDKKGIQMPGVDPNKIDIYKHDAVAPDIVHFPLLIEPTPTTTGILTVDQTKSLQFLSSSSITLPHHVSPQTLKLSTPTLSSPTEYNTKTISESASLLNQEATETLYARTSIDISTSETPTASEVDYIDLDAESPDAIRFYQKEEGDNPIPGFFEKIILTSSDDQKEAASSQNRQQVDSSTHSTHTSYTDSGSIAPTTCSAALSAVATPGLPGAEAAASPEQPDEQEEASFLKNFKSYHSIDDTSLEKLVNQVRDLLEQKPEQQPLWVVLEKIHGSNFSFWTDGKEVKVASRYQWIKDGDFFSAMNPFMRNTEK